MQADYRRVLVLLAIAGGVVLWLNGNYSQSVGTAYLLLLAVCAVVYWRPPKTMLDYIFLAGAFISLWLHINTPSKEDGVIGVVASMIGYMIL